MKEILTKKFKLQRKVFENTISALKFGLWGSGFFYYCYTVLFYYCYTALFLNLFSLVDTFE